MNLDLLPIDSTRAFNVANDWEWATGIDHIRANLPDAMLDARRWIVWKLIPNKDPTKKGRKVPFYVDGGTRIATDTPDDLARMGTYDAAREVLDRGGFTGLGFALGPDGTGNHWQGVDLDHLSEHPELSGIAERLGGYVEWSPSGDGLHGVGYGRAFDTLGSDRSGTEAYAKARYFTVTGDRVRGEVEDLAGFVARELVPLRGKIPKPDQGPGVDDLPVI